jgi:hypothetical protein
MGIGELHVKGKELFSQVVALTGLPETHVSTELHRLLQGLGVNPDQMTIDDLRRAVTLYLAEIFQSDSAH